MPSDLEPPTRHAIADGWAEFPETVLPSIGGTDHAQADIAFHFGATYTLGIVKEIVAYGSAEAAALALSALGPELDEVMKSHAVAIQ